MKNQKGRVDWEILIVIVALICAGGWIANIVKMFAALSDPVTGMLIARAVGIFFAPLGVILGFL